MSAPSASRTVTLGLPQMRLGADPAANLARLEQFIREAAGRGAQVICTPELFQGPYFCQVESHEFFRLAEPVPGPTTERLSALAQELSVVIVASLFEKRAEGLYHNTAAILDADGRYLGKYRKMHIPDDPQYHEKFYFTPGDTGFRSWPTRYARLGVLICWDQWYPEAARLTAMAGAALPLLPHPPRRLSALPPRDRLAARGKGRVRRAPAGGLGDGAAGPRHRERLLPRGGQPR